MYARTRTNPHATYVDIHIQITHTCTEHVVYTHVYTHNTHTYIHAGLDGPFR